MKIQCPIKVGDRVAVLRGVTLSMSRRNEIYWAKVSKVRYSSSNTFQIVLNKSHYWFYVSYLEISKKFVIQNCDSPNRYPDMNSFYNTNRTHIYCVALDYKTLAELLITFKIGFNRKSLNKFLYTANQLKQNKNKFFTTTSEVIIGT